MDNILTPIQTLLMIFAIAAGTMITRFLPFLVFPENKKVPDIVNYLGKKLPPAMMGLLVVYCLRNVEFTINLYRIPELIAIAGIVVVHLWKKNVLLSIGTGTLLYMVLIRLPY